MRTLCWQAEAEDSAGGVVDVCISEGGGMPFFFTGPDTKEAGGSDEKLTGALLKVPCGAWEARGDGKRGGAKGGAGFLATAAGAACGRTDATVEGAEPQPVVNATVSARHAQVPLSPPTPTPFP